MPNVFVPIGSGTDVNMAIAQINSNFAKLDAEAVTKTFSGANNTKLILGKTATSQLGMSVTQGTNTQINFGNYTPSKYGFVLYDANGIPSVLIGQAPDDGRMGIWQAKPGQNVITQLGG